MFGSSFNLEDLEDVIMAFDLGQSAQTGSDRPAAEYPALLDSIEGLSAAVTPLTGGDQRPEVIAAAVEFVLEGLHLSRRLNCDRSGDVYRYSR